MPARAASNPASTSPRTSTTTAPRTSPAGLVIIFSPRSAIGRSGHPACQASRERGSRQGVDRLGGNREAGCMQVSELMLRDVTLVPAGDSVQDAARAIADVDSRFILVGVDDRVAGVLTIRDILIRLVAAGLDPIATTVSQVMSSSLFTCTEQEDAESVVERMTEHRIEQMPVLDESGRLVGVITRQASETLAASRPAR